MAYTDQAETEALPSWRLALPDGDELHAFDGMTLDPDQSAFHDQLGASRRGAVPWNVVWEPPPGSSRTPRTFVPDPLWFPSPIWPFEPAYRWWTVTNQYASESDDERAAATARQILADDLAHPDPATLLVSQRKVMWQAPPTWPQVPLGTFPRRGWRPDPAWGPVPPGWRFIRSDPYALADYLDATDAALTQSPTAVEVLLNTAEGYLARAVEVVRRLDRLSKRADKLGLRPADDERVKAAALNALVKVRSQVAQMRAYVLGALSWGPAFDMELSRRRRELAQACSSFATFASVWRLSARMTVLGAQLADLGRQPKKRARFYAEDQAAAHVLAPFEAPFDSSVPARCARELLERGFGILRPARVDGEVVVRGNQVFARVHVDDSCPARGKDVDAPPYFERGRAALVHFSAGGFSRGALELADRKNIALFNVAEEVTAANDAALYLWTPTPH